MEISYFAKKIASTCAIYFNDVTVKSSLGEALLRKPVSQQKISKLRPIFKMANIDYMKTSSSAIKLQAPALFQRFGCQMVLRGRFFEKNC